MAGCVERGSFRASRLGGRESGSFRASRLGGRRCFYRLGVCGWVLNFAFGFGARRVAGCVERSSFRASRLGERRCLYRLGVCGWVFKIDVVLWCVAWFHRFSYSFHRFSYDFHIVFVWKS